MRRRCTTLRTLVKVQLRRGGGLVAQARALLAAGGVPRLYAGLGAARLMAPASRFCDLASNAGALPLRAVVLLADLGHAVGWRQ